MLEKNYSDFILFIVRVITASEKYTILLLNILNVFFIPMLHDMAVRDVWDTFQFYNSEDYSIENLLKICAVVGKWKMMEISAHLLFSRPLTHLLSIATVQGQIL